MEIERWDYGLWGDGWGKWLLDELTVIDIDNLHIERLGHDKVFVGLASKNRKQIRIYFEVERDGILNWWFEYDEPEPNLVPPCKESK